MKRLAQISGFVISVGILGAIFYFWSREQYEAAGYIMAGFLFVSYLGRVIYALVYEKRTGRTPMHEES
ncbi:MAG: hypothetical protein KC900_13810 [Candidatus Omnitrophica bacterium]|nr:hypothetical protein [Candidatus Omnitrophota bacterium]